MGAAVLRLCQPPPATAILRLGMGDPCLARLPEIAPEIDLRTLALGTLDATLPAHLAEFTATYDHAVWRGVGATRTGRWQEGANVDASTQAVHGDSLRLRAHPAIPWCRAARLMRDTLSGHAELWPFPARILSGWQTAAGLVQHPLAATWQDRRRRPRPVEVAAWAAGLPVLRTSLAPWQERHRRPRPVEVSGWGLAAPVLRAWYAGHQPARPAWKTWGIPWGEGRDLYGWGGPWTPPPIVPVYAGCYPPPRVATLYFIDRLALDRRTLHFYCRGETRFVPRLRTYLMLHDIDVVRLPDRTPIAASRVALSLDADAWTWECSAELAGRAALDAVQPDPDGTPVVLEINLDGYLWHILVETWSENRQFGRRGVQIRGRSLAARLAAPYVLPGSGVSTADQLIQQIAADHLPPSGWSLTWDAPAWLVPAGAWSWQGKTSAQAIAEIAAAAGLVVHPARAAQALTVRRRYPVLPWDYGAATPDLVVPDGAMLALDRRNVQSAQANAVYVHGAEVGGVLARVKRTGTAGDRLASTFSHPLITHADAAREAGSRLLAAQHSPPAIRQFGMPLDSVTFPLVEIGQLLRIEDGQDYTLATAAAVSIDAAVSASCLTLRQTVGLGEDTPNVWARFRDLIPSDPLRAGTVATVHGDGTTTLTLPTGGALRVRGTGFSPGAQVYARAGRIEGMAPTLPVYDLEV